MKIKHIYYTYELPELDFYPYVIKKAKEIAREVYEHPDNERLNKAIAMIAGRGARVIIQHSPYREFMSKCLKRELSGKENTLADTWSAFSKCAVEWKKKKLESKNQT